MKQIAGLICVALMLGHFIGQVGAQDATPTAMFVEEPKPAPVTPPPYEQTEGQGLLQVAYGFNICPEEIVEANRDLIPLEAIIEHWPGSLLNPNIRVPLPANLIIPPHEDCYTVLTPVWNEHYAQIERDYNICLEEFAFTKQRIKDPKVQYGEYDAVFLRKNALPCVNDKGQRLNYFDSYGKFLDTPVYSDLPFIDDYDPVKPGYCAGDMVRVNPQFSLNTDNPYSIMIYMKGMRLFVPPDARRCEPFQTEPGLSLYDLSRTNNVCMEDILEANGRYLIRIKEFSYYLVHRPMDLPPCYDADGKRIGYNDRGLYETHVGESFLGIARDHDVCFDDLWNANPVMATWSGVSGILPEVVFLPSTSACDFTNATLTIPPDQTLQSLSLLTNICVNRLLEANAWLQKLDPDVLDVLPAGETINVPQRPDCYTLNFSPYLSDLKMVPYVCYAIPVTGEDDFTGHDPVITASNTVLPYCYERQDSMTIIYQNEPYTLYRIRGYESYRVISQCFDVPINELQNLNMQDSPWTTYQDTTKFWGGLLIPQPHANCVLDTSDDGQHHQDYMAMTYNAGSLQDDVYLVNYQDTLSSIGRRFGYPYQWIADANNIPAPYTIYYLQELKMPTIPSLYTLIPVGGAAGVIVLASSAIYGLRRWSRSRAKGKKKNEAA